MLILNVFSQEEIVKMINFIPNDSMNQLNEILKGNRLQGITAIILVLEFIATVIILKRNLQR